MMRKVYVVGIGPGSYEQMTIKAVRTLELSDIIVGYTVYVDLIKQQYPEKTYLTTPMTQEVKRCRRWTGAGKHWSLQRRERSCQ